MNKSSLKILIIDDSETFLNQMTEYLSSLFNDIYCSHNGTSALALVKDVAIDIAIVDVKLTDCSGLDLMVKIKEIRPNCVIIIITGYGTTDIAVKALKNGILDYIEKPINFEQLYIVIGRAIQSIETASNRKRTETLLIIEPDIVLLDELTLFFKKKGFIVKSDSVWDRNSKVFFNDMIDVVIADFRLDDISGIDVFKMACNTFYEVEGILIADLSDKKFVMESLSDGILYNIYKPIDYQELLIYVRKAFNSLHLRRQIKYKDREIKLTADIISKSNIELERKVSERTQELAKTQTQLFQTSKLVTLGEMSAGLAHEINQPLTEILLTVHNINKRLERDISEINIEEVKKSLLGIKDSGTRIDTIIKHIRTFARQGSLNFSHVNINDYVKIVFTGLLGSQLKSHGIDVSVELDSEMQKIYAEPHQIEQVIINLVNNARDSMDEKEKQIGSFDKIIEISTKYNSEKEEVSIQVLDNGLGMSKEQQTKIFEPFYTTKEIGKSTGLGLSISYGIVESHKGRIEVESEEGIGAIFRIILPAGEKDDKNFDNR
ncbi:MAG: response regulator [Nitrospirae bacterium]|nr:response regulator [Nitrospirota bacterium]MBF0541217.1 response regulator [Nitrospirota bacterium]